MREVKFDTQLEAELFVRQQERNGLFYEVRYINFQYECFIPPRYYTNDGVLIQDNMFLYQDSDDELFVVDRVERDKIYITRRRDNTQWQKADFVLNSKEMRNKERNARKRANERFRRRSEERIMLVFIVMLLVAYGAVGYLLLNR